MDKDIISLTNKLKKEYGTLRIAEEEKEIALDMLSTGNLALDLILEGGIPMGQVVEWSGFSGSGKSLMLQILLRDFQYKYPDGIAIWLDRENAFSSKRAIELGVDLSSVIVIKPADLNTVPDAEVFLRKILESCKDREIHKFIAIDSISAFAEGSDPMKSDMGKKAKSIHHLFKEILPLVDINTSFHFANQITFKVGIQFGDNTTVTSGEAVKYYASTRIKVDDKKKIIDKMRGNEVLGNWIRATVIKTRHGPNYRYVDMPFLFKSGIDYHGGYARLLANRGYIKPNNVAEFDRFLQSTFSYKESKRLSEFNMADVLQKYPELLFEKYPDYNSGKSEDE